MKKLSQPKDFSSIESGFTLMEILVVIALIVILATAVLAILNPFEQIKKGNDGRRKFDLEQIQHALDLYYNDQGKYPASTADYKISAITPPTNNPQTYTWGTAWQPYIGKLPADPTNGQKYVYYSPASSNGQTYYLYASLQRGNKDPQVCNNGAACVNVPAANACGNVCNYGVSSSNVSP